MEKEEELLDSLLDFCTAVEAAVVQLKRNLFDLAVKANDAKSVWDVANVKWERVQGERGEYERASCELNAGNKDFDNMLADLKAHGGKMRKGGYFFWLFEFSDKPVVGRKPVRKAVQ